MDKMESIQLLTSLRKSDDYSINVISKATKLVKELDPTPKVTPTNKNSVILEWETNNMFLEMEIFEDKITIYNHCSFDGINSENIGG